MKKTNHFAGVGSLAMSRSQVYKPLMPTWTPSDVSPTMTLEEFVRRLTVWFKIRGDAPGFEEYKAVSKNLWPDICHSSLFYKIFIEGKVDGKNYGTFTT